jgi:hypothetical protein
MTNRTLSPAAQAVLDAFLDSPVDAGNYYATRSRQIAAALRAAVGHDVYKADLRDQMEVMFSEGWNSLRKEILAIADELEAS